MPKKKPDNGPVAEDSHRAVTQRDIARELGISHVTVSLALRDRPRISEATRIRVQAKAKEMGYHPDPMLSALSHYRLTSKDRPMQATLAWINPLEDPGHLMDHEEFSLYWKGAEAAAKRLGFHLEEFRTKELSLKRMDTIFKTRSIRGLIIVPLAFKTTRVDWDEFPWQDYAGVRFGRTEQGPELHCISSAQVSDTIVAFEVVLSKGYQRIGFVGNQSPRRLFTAGYLRAQQRVPGDRRLPLLSYNGEPVDLSRDALAHWLDTVKPDAIITDNRLLPSMLKNLNYRIPEDIGVATMSIHDTPINAGIDQNPEEIGRAAIRTLDSLLNEHHFGIPQNRSQILVEGHWIEGSMLPIRSECIVNT